ncbi:hypothetical protein [Francisella persica]|uniref:hypothetical protein n=1 Tax=Francisella persica TaxID=954 RepID=UPI000AD2C2F6|nr:hypothetical protein [Francisella persica]
MFFAFVNLYDEPQIKRFLEKTFLVLGHDVEIVDIAGNATKLLGEYHILCCYS